MRRRTDANIFIFSLTSSSLVVLDVLLEDASHRFGVAGKANGRQMASWWRSKAESFAESLRAAFGLRCQGATNRPPH